jgi:hypothetical protein
MSRRAVVVAFAVAASLPLAGQTPPAPRFRLERSVEIASPGAQRLDFDVALLAGAKPFTVTAQSAGTGVRSIARNGASDLRLFNAAGGEIPYLLMPPPITQPSMASSTVLPVVPTEKTSGFEVDLGGPRLIDALHMLGIPPPFLKRFTLEGSGDRQRWTALVSEGTAFDLPAEELRHTQIPFAPGSYRYLRVTWDDTNSGRVAPPAAATARLVERFAAGPPLVAPLTFERRPSEPGRSRFRIRLPGSQLPVVALDLKVSGGYLLRDARVMEARVSGSEAQPTLIGQSRLRRAVRDGVAADALRVPIRQPREPQLDLVVDDGSNPPLELTGVSAVFAELPWIFFESPAGTVTARYGDPRLAAPRYDLEAARAAVPDDPARAGWGAAPPAGIVAEPEAAPMPETGSVIDAMGFQYVREIPPGAAGLITVPLDAPALAHSASIAGRFRDVRVIDIESRQVPYLLERRDEPITIDLVLERKDLDESLVRDRRSTSYAIQLPFDRLPQARLTLTTLARVFRRSVTVATLVEPDERHREPRLLVLATHPWSHADSETPAGPLTFEVPERLAGALWVIVDEGDNQPLPIQQATLLLPSYAIRLFRRADLPLRLAYGHKELLEPRYDLALLAPQVMGRVATEVAAAAESAAEPSPALQLVPPPVFWSFLGIAVVILLALVVRLIRREVSSPG